MPDDPQTDGRTLRALVLEDDPADFELIERQIRGAGRPIECRHVETEREFTDALSSDIDVILSDFTLRGWNALGALDALKASGFDIPFLVVSGTITEELAIECMQHGAADYLLKDRLARLPRAVLQAIDSAAEQRRAAQARRTEQELRRLEAILDGLTEAVLIADPRGRVRSMNAAAVRLHGYESLSQALADLSDFPGALEASEASGRPFSKDEWPLQRSLRGEVVSNIEMHVTNPATGRSWVGSYSSTPVRNSSGAPIQMVVTIRDTTERVRFEGELRETEERLREAQKMESIGVLAGGIAHDFNNLLVGIVGSASLALEMAGAESPIRELLEIIVKSGQDAGNLTKQMLAYAGQGKFIAEPLDLSVAVRGFLPLLHSSIQKKIAVDLDLPAGMPAVEADRLQIQQIFINLALNAAEAIGPSAGRISVKTGVTDLDEDLVDSELRGSGIEPGRYVWLEVRDDGCGMDEATKARVFEPFFTTKFMGRGLGLAAVSGIVRAHHGAIRVQTAPGAGSVFTVFFPAAAGAGPKEAPTIRGEAEEAIEGAGTVLVVDDEEVVRQVARRALELHGYRVLVAESGRSALDVFERERDRVRLVILDMSMPGLSGEETLPELLRLKPDLDVIVSSGYAETETMRSFEGLRVSGFLQKPYSSRQLARRVRAAIGA